MLVNLGTYKGILVGPHCFESWGLILQKMKSKIRSQKLTSPSFQSLNVLEQKYFFLSRSWHFCCCLIVCLQFLLLCSEFVKVDLIFYMMEQLITVLILYSSRNSIYSVLKPKFVTISLPFQIMAPVYILRSVMKEPFKFLSLVLCWLSSSSLP